jgi:mannan endo-1,4-beta-mannosidase
MGTVLNMAVLSPTLSTVAARTWNPSNAADPLGSPDLIEPVLSQPNAAVYEENFPFVTRAGSELLVDGQPFRFTGLNIFNANSVHDSCWGGLGAGGGLDEALTTIGPGQTVFRAWFFQPMATNNGERDWSAFDHTLAVARQHGVRVIATLGNFWNDCEGSAVPARYRTESWFRTGYRLQRAAGLPATYREWAAEVVSRYRNDPTIMAWQLMNEASTPSDNGSGACTPTSATTLRAFTQDMAAMVKSIDANHLLSLGTVGGGECGTRGADYVSVHSVPGIDLCEMHDYGPAAEPIPTNRDNGLARRLAQCRTLNKPLFMGETGMETSPALSVAQRASALRARLSAEFEAGVVGSLIWDWCTQVRSCDSYEVGAEDPALALLGT